MELKQLTSKNLVLVDLDVKTKDEAIRYLVKKLFEAGKLESEEDFYKAVIAREALSPTGLEAGLAVPHGRSDTVREGAFAVAKLRKPIKDWESIDENNEVEFVFLLAIPESGSELHLKILAALATRIVNDEYKERLKNSKTAEELYLNLDNYKEQEYNFSNSEYKKSIVAVTACPAGIAHTYMAAEALQKAGKELGVAIYVEKQGANGIEDRHTEEQLRNADVAIFAGFISFWVYPVIGSLLVGTLMLLVFGKPIGAINTGFISWLGSLTGTNAAIFGAILGVMVSFDLGGPINKAAYTFCIGAMGSGNFIPYATFASVKMVSGFSITAATSLFKKYFKNSK